MATFLAVCFVLLELTALVMAWRAVKYSRTSQGSVGWVVFLIAAPYIAVPAYLFLGHHKFEHYVTGRRDSEEIIERIQQVSADLKPDVALPVPTQALNTTSDLPAQRRNTLAPLDDRAKTMMASVPTH